MFTVEFQMTVLTKDLEQHFDLLRRKVNDASARLPQGCYDPIVIDDMMDVYGIFYAFTADGYDYPEMYQYARLIKRVGNAVGARITQRLVHRDGDLLLEVLRLVEEGDLAGEHGRLIGARVLRLFEFVEANLEGEGEFLDVVADDDLSIADLARRSHAASQ